MNKKSYALIGHPVSHTVSPFIHRRLFELSKTDASYSVHDIHPESLRKAVREFNELAGYNVTIPHKQNIIQYLPKLDRKASLYGSVNTVKNEGITTGFTTDADGFLLALKSKNMELNGRIIIVGAGGTARTIAYECTVAGANVTLAVRSSGLLDASVLSGKIRESVPNMDINTCLIDRLTGPIDLIINATPAGMYPNIDQTPVPQSVIEQCANVFDVVYNPLETKLIKIAKANGANVLNGVSMLVWQAVKSHNIWDGSVYDESDILALCEDTEKELKRRF